MIYLKQPQEVVSIKNLYPSVVEEKNKLRRDLIMHKKYKDLKIGSVVGNNPMAQSNTD